MHGHYELPSLDEASNVEARLARSLERSDRDVCALAAQRCVANLLFYGPATALTVWIVHAVWTVGWLVSGVVALALFGLAVQAAIGLSLHLTALPARPFRPRGGRGCAWLLLAAAIAAADLAVTGGCLVLVGQATEWWGIFG